MRAAHLACAALLLLAGPALALDARDRSFGPGRVGAIVQGATKPADLAKIYGAENVRETKIQEPGGGQESPGAFIFHDTPDALELTFTEDGKGIVSVSIHGKNWASKAGLRQGANLADLERINGGPFELAGFGWDYGGRVFARGRALQGMDIFVSPTRGSAKARDAVTGDRKFSSRHPALKELGVKVVVIQVRFGP
jgi:hypothetical protein